MDLDEIFRIVQKAMQNPPLILVGSGGSAPYGLPTMSKLANHLKDSLGLRYQDDYYWQRFVENLDDGQDLETALTGINLNDDILESIRIETWKLISDKDVKLFEDVILSNKELAIGKLIKHFYQAHPKCVNVVTTNYDRVIEYACDSFDLPICLGFEGLYAKRFNHCFKNSNCVNIVKVHGSLDLFIDTHKTTIGIPLLKEFPIGLVPEIITPGSSKYQAVLKGTIRELLHEADRMIDNAEAFLCIGYGFNDEQIQEKIITKIQQGIPIVIITMELSDKATHLINEKAKHSIIIQKGDADNTSVCINRRLYTLPGNYWSIDGFMKILD